MQPEYLYHFACFSCRKSVKRVPTFVRTQEKMLAVVQSVLCPHCARPMQPMGRKFRTPPRAKRKQWQKIEMLQRNGWALGYASRGDLVSLRSTRAYLQDRPRRVAAARQNAKQNAQQGKWSTMRKWPHIHT